MPGCENQVSPIFLVALLYGSYPMPVMFSYCLIGSYGRALFCFCYFDAIYFSCHRTLARLASFVPLIISVISSSASAKVISPSPFMSP